jgi:hypothetical protein
MRRKPITCGHVEDVAIARRLIDAEVGVPDDPEEAAVRIPLPGVPRQRRVHAGGILHVPQVGRRAQRAVRPTLVEPNAVGLVVCLGYGALFHGGSVGGAPRRGRLDTAATVP